MKYQGISLPKTFFFVSLIFILVIWILPLYYLLTMSVKPLKAIFSRIPVFLFCPTLVHYRSTFDAGFLRYIANSLIIVNLHTMLSLALGVPAGYALSRLKFKGKQLFLFGIMGARMIAPISIVIPVFLIYMWLKILDTYSGLILVYLTFNLPLVIWLTKTSFDEVPAEIETAAQIDGASTMNIFVRISIPLGMPGIIAAAVLTWIFAWNEFLYALILTQRNAQTITVGISSFFRYELVEWGALAAASNVVAVPVIILSLLVGKHMIRGLTKGALQL